MLTRREFIRTAALFALAVWLSKGRRRKALRTTGWCFVGIGLFVILDRRVAGNLIVNGLVKDQSNRPAAHQAWTILTSRWEPASFVTVPPQLGRHISVPS